MGTLARELKRAGVSLMVLWEEYRQTEPDGYGYSRFCDLFREFERRLSPVMRQHHVAGDKVFVDYSGKRIAIVDPGTGVVHDAEIFVGVLGASSYTYAEATFTQTLPDWIGAHVRMFRFFGGVPRLVVPDNLKSGVHKASFYDPEINRSYGMMAAHYGVGVLPARPSQETREVVRLLEPLRGVPPPSGGRSRRAHQIRREVSFGRHPNRIGNAMPSLEESPGRIRPGLLPGEGVGCYPYQRLPLPSTNTAPLPCAFGMHPVR